MLENNLQKPLLLKWDNAAYQYKVNKPRDQSGEYIDKSIAVDMIESLQEFVLACYIGCSKSELDQIRIKAEMAVSKALGKDYVNGKVFYKPVGTTLIRSYPTRQILANFLGVGLAELNTAIKDKVAFMGYIVANTEDELK